MTTSRPSSRCLGTVLIDRSLLHITAYRRRDTRIGATSAKTILKGNTSEEQCELTLDHWYRTRVITKTRNQSRRATTTDKGRLLLSTDLHSKSETSWLKAED